MAATHPAASPVKSSRPPHRRGDRPVSLPVGKVFRPTSRSEQRLAHLKPILSTKSSSLAPALFSWLSVSRYGSLPRHPGGG